MSADYSQKTPDEDNLSIVKAEHDQSLAAYVAGVNAKVSREELAELQRMQRFWYDTLLLHEERLNALTAPPQSVQIQPVQTSSQDEEWRDVMPRRVEPAFEKLFRGVFQVSNRGRVRNTKTNVVRHKPPQVDNPNRYPTYNLSVTYGKDKRKQVRAFIYEMLIDAFGMKKADSLKIAGALVAKNNWQKQVRERHSGKQGKRKSRGHLTAAIAIEIRDLHSRGWSRKAIADRYGIDPSTVGKICRGALWGHAGNSVSP